MKLNSPILAFAAILLSLFFIGCGKSSDPAAPTMIGTWRAATYATNNCTNISNNVPETACTAGPSCPTIVITGTTITSDTGVVDYTITGNTLSISGNSAIKSGTFVLTATTLTLTYPLGSPYAGCINVVKYTRV